MMHELHALQLAAQRGQELQSAARRHNTLRAPRKPKHDFLQLAIEKHQVNRERRMLNSLRLRTGL
jgi:hypothetical protein